MFKRLTELFLQDQAARAAKNEKWIIYGNESDIDRGLRHYSTDLRWDQYKTGKISRQKAIDLAIIRMRKQEQKNTEAGLARLDMVSKAPELTTASIDIEWIRSSTWGYNPHCESWSDNGRTYGRASGCGYDKESTCIAEAFNQDNTMLKILYTLKEAGLAAGMDDTSGSACTGHDNRNIIGYGAGYSVLPYYEGGVGSSCFWSIIKKAGYKIEGYHTKKSDHYRITRA